MRKKIIYFVGLLLWMIIESCTPDEYTVVDQNSVSPEMVARIELRQNHYQVLADGRAELELRPVMYNEEGFEIPDSRVNDDWLEYRSPDGKLLARYFSTSDKNLVGQELKVFARLKDKDIYSDTVAFTVEEPLNTEDMEEITIPVIFHLIQSNDEVVSFGGKYPAEKIDMTVLKLNQAFAGTISKNAAGVDTKIHFKAALYDPYGRQLAEPGINRIYVSEVQDDAKDRYDTFIREQQAVWSYKDYFNIWIISDAANLYKKFCNEVSWKCGPRYKNAGFSGDIPEGLKLSVLPENWNPQPGEVGLKYKMQTLNRTKWVCSATEETELISCIGTYLGLLPTWNFGRNKFRDDYCTDTPYYESADAGEPLNKTWYKTTAEGYYFLSENIMDDPTGLHRSITKQQCRRIRWVLENCPERSAWKSDFAFTGKK